MKWGILGAARINRSIIPALRAAEGHTLEAIASRDAGKAAAAAAEWGIPRSVAGYDALLADPGIDAVYIPLPNGDHVEWTLKALAWMPGQTHSRAIFAAPRTPHLT